MCTNSRSTRSKKECGKESASTADMVVGSALQPSRVPRHIYLLSCKWQTSVCRELCCLLLPLQTSAVEEEDHFMMVPTVPLESKRTEGTFTLRLQ